MKNMVAPFEQLAELPWGVGVKRFTPKSDKNKTVQELRLRIFRLIETLKKFLQEIFKPIRNLYCEAGGGAIRLNFPLIF